MSGSFACRLGQFTKLFVIALISAAIQYSLTFTGLAGIDASVAALVVQLEVPFLVLIGAIFLGEKTGLRKWIGIAVAFTGVGLIAGEPKLGCRVAVAAHGGRRRILVGDRTGTGAKPQGDRPP